MEERTVIAKPDASWSIAKGFCMIMLFFPMLADSFAQEILNEQGEPIPQNLNVEFVPNEIIANFLPGTITLPEGRIEANLAEVTLHPQVEPLLRAWGASKVRKVFSFFTPADTIRTLETGEKVQVQDLSQIFLLSFPAGLDVPATVRKFKTAPRVIHAQPNYTYEEDARPNDPYWQTQWALEQGSDEDIDMTAAWDIQTGNYSIKLGIFDTGLDYGHDDLGNAFGSGWKVAGGYNWVNITSDPRDDRYHGTHVGVAGVAGGWGYERSTNTGSKGAALYAMKILDAEGETTTDRAANAIIHGADPNGVYRVHVLNNSWGGYSYDETLRSAVNYAARMNRVFVASKGNRDTDLYHYPSDYDASWVISVGATNEHGFRARHGDWGWPQNTGSNYGNGIDVVAPGTYIYSTTPTYITPAMSSRGISASYDYLSGTSMAAPHVSGLAALILSHNSTLHPEDVEGIIRASADDKGSTGYDNEYGAGRINAGRALQYMQSPWTLNQWTASGGTSVGNTGKYQATFWNTGGGLATGVYLVKRYDVRKTVTFPTRFSGTPYAWGRGVNATVGWSAANPNYQTGYCKVVSSTATSAELQTYVYEVWNMGGQYLGMYPTSPSNVSFAYTVLGVPWDQEWKVSQPPSGEGASIAEKFSLEQNFPNPFNREAEIRYALSKNAHVTLKVYSILGEEIQTLTDGERSAGYCRVRWNGTDASGKQAPSGIYLYRMEARSTQSSEPVFVATRKMMLLH